MLGSRINLPIPGGWSKGEGSTAEGAKGEDVPRSVAAGVVDEAGNVVDDTGKTVAQITEGKPQDLTGNVVAATGDIVGSTGDVLGKAVPLGGEDANEKSGEEEDAAKGGNYTLKGVTDTVGGVVGTVGSTVDTVNKVHQPLTGQLGKTLGGLGGGSEASTQKPIPKQAEQSLPAQSEVEGVKSEAGGDKATNLQGKSITDVTGEKAPTVDEGSGDNAVPEISLEDKEEGITSQVQKSKSQLPEDEDVPASQLPLKSEAGQTKPSELAPPTEQQPLGSKAPGDGDDDKTGTALKGEITPEDSISNIGGKSATKLPTEGQVEEQMNVVDPDEMQVKDDGTEVPVSKSGLLPEDKKTDAVPSEAKSGLPSGVPALSQLPSDAPTELKEQAAKAAEAGDGSVAPGTEGAEAPAAEGEAAEEEGAKIDFSVLKGCKVNKMGNVVNDKSQVVGRIVSGILKHLIGRKTDENGEIWNDSGKIIGKAEPIPENELEEFKEPAPFEDFPDAVVESNGKVMWNGEAIGIVVEGDPKKLKGKKVDEDGDILDKAGNKLGRAERWEEEEPEPEPEVVVDRSILAGKRVNKLGNVCDSSGTIYGRLVEGDPKRLAGRMCDKDGNVRSESGDIIGRAEVVPEGEREGLKEGPFAELEGCTVAKDGTVVTPSGDIVGRLIKGDGKVLFGRSVDDDGDVLDRNGNVLGKAERWEPPEAEPEPEKVHGPMFGRKVNREGNVVDENGDLIGKLTSGDVTICSGKAIDDDGDVVDSKGNIIGHASLLADIPPEPEPEPEVETETPEEKAKREQEEQDRKLAKQMAATLTQCLDRIKPICKMITAKIEKAERTPKEELDEDALVKEVKPLIEEGSKILQEANGIIRGLDPDGHIQANAKHKTAGREASPEEYHLADVLKELTGTVTETIDNAKKKIEDMPKAKKELNPLWGLLTEPLFQILAAVGLLLNGVLELVGRLLSGLGLGGIVNNILGGLGITNVLKSLGVGGVVDALTGKKKNDGKKGGGALGLFV